MSVDSYKSSRRSSLGYSEISDTPEGQLNFNNITVEHNCIFQKPKNNIEYRCPKDDKLCFSILSRTVASKQNVDSKRYFKSNRQINKEIFRHMTSNYWYIIHPFSRFRFVWNSLMILALYIGFIYIPLRVGFYKHLKGGILDWIVICFLNFFYCIDIFLNFFTGYKNEKKKRVTIKHPKIIWKYLKGFFFLDLLSTYPYNMVLKGIFFNHQEEVIRWCFLLRLFSFKKAERYLKTYAKQFKWSYIMKTITIISLKSVVFTHWAVCIYGVFINEIHKDNPYNTTILMRADKNLQPEPVHNEPAIIRHIFHVNMNFIQNYLLSFINVAWSMYGASLGTEFDLFSLEGKLITSAMMIFSYVFQIYITVKIVNLIDIIVYSDVKFHEAMNQVEAYMEKMQFPIHLRNRIKTFYAKKFRGKYFMEETLLANLPEPLRKQIMINAGQSFVRKAHIFRHVPKDLILTIISCMKKEQFLPNDLIYKAGTVGTRIYFIASGTVSITTTNGKELNHLHDGDYFGEIALITNCLKRLITVTALEFCELYILEEVDFIKYVQPNELIMKRLTDAATIKMDVAFKAEELYKKQLHEKFYMQSED